MITYDEPNADENWFELVSRYPTAKRVNKIKGILNAHKICANKSNTSLFWVVDGDSVLLPFFKLDFIPDSHQAEFVHVWYAKNPINDLLYGYGGVKLLPKDLVLNISDFESDLTTSLGGLVLHSTPASITAFNSSPFCTWRAAFRECVKLNKGLKNSIAEENAARLQTWLTVGADRTFGKFAVEGASHAMHFDKDISIINDFDWLYQEFKKLYPDEL